ncbi:uncharacterized protein LAESUDRAFT_812372 [Laetiporus sulphureus 93-53]|uniref:CNH domain-containing protein n=1 Tax=Laetiporus sulphureus 93-53 TaxID=1314785 RepID=A0A165EGT4_9APHY|nr:uncharacterized protein LAESUDRAFT_812372 [Laetiporus sulphureus 93-53]KZT07023.1 hypothetical protein LAESUDRAFT_812372 [Laetiporus sulphureus 93-53]
MTSAPVAPVDVPPYQLQPLIASVLDRVARPSAPSSTICCAQALGAEIYVGCSDGELLRFALQPGSNVTPDSYSLQSRQSVVVGKPIKEIILVPSISRALLLADGQVYIYTLPSLDMVPSSVIRPIRGVVTIAADEEHLRRPAASASSQGVQPVDFCVIKKSSIEMYSLQERLKYHSPMPLPSGVVVAKRTGQYVCIADERNYSLINLNSGQMFEVLPLNQAGDDFRVKPSVTVINECEFLMLSWTGNNTLGVFITGEGDPVRGTLEWPLYPDALFDEGLSVNGSDYRDTNQSAMEFIVAPQRSAAEEACDCSRNDEAHMTYGIQQRVFCLDYPYTTALLPSDTIEIHNIETLTIVQVVPAPPASPIPTPGAQEAADRNILVACMRGFLVPSTQRLDKLRRTPVRLVRKREPDAEGSARAEPEREAGEGEALMI